MADEGYLYDASETPVPPARWVPLGAADTGVSRILEIEYDAAGTITAIHDVERTDHPVPERWCMSTDDDPDCWAKRQHHPECGARCQFTPPDYVPPPAMEQGRPYTAHRYPPPKASRQPDTEWTIGDALEVLDPTPPRRTLTRWLASLQPTGERRLPSGGPPARTYRAADIMRRHALWVALHWKRGRRTGVVR